MNSEEEMQKQEKEERQEKPQVGIPPAPGETPVVISGGSFQITSGLTFEDDDAKPGHHYKVRETGTITEVRILDGNTNHPPIVITDPTNLTILIRYRTP